MNEKGLMIKSGSNPGMIYNDVPVKHDKGHIKGKVRDGGI